MRRNIGIVQGKHCSKNAISKGFPTKKALLSTMIALQTALKRKLRRKLHISSETEPSKMGVLSSFSYNNWARALLFQWALFGTVVPVILVRKDTEKKVPKKKRERPAKGLRDSN